MAGVEVHALAIGGVLAALLVGHAVGGAVLRVGLATADAARRSRAPLGAMVARIAVTVPLLAALIVLGPGVLSGVVDSGGGDASGAAGTSPDPAAARRIIGLWAAAGYALLTAWEARVSLRAYCRAGASSAAAPPPRDER